MRGDLTSIKVVDVVRMSLRNGIVDVLLMNKCMYYNLEISLMRSALHSGDNLDKSS